MVMMIIIYLSIDILQSLVVVQGSQQRTTSTMKQAWKLVKAEVYGKIHAHSLVLIHSKLTQLNYIAWQKELELIATSYDISLT